jgi:hypothetical protein
MAPILNIKDPKKAQILFGKSIKITITGIAEIRTKVKVLG